MVWVWIRVSATNFRTYYVCLSYTKPIIEGAVFLILLILRQKVLNVVNFGVILILFRILL